MFPFFPFFSEIFPFLPHSYKKNIFLIKINSKNQYKKPRTQCNKQSIHNTNTQYKSIQEYKSLQPISPCRQRPSSLEKKENSRNIYIYIYIYNTIMQYTITPQSTGLSYGSSHETDGKIGVVSVAV